MLPNNKLDDDNNKNIVIGTTNRIERDNEDNNDNDNDDDDDDDENENLKYILYNIIEIIYRNVYIFS